MTVRALGGKEIAESAYRTNVAAGETITGLHFGRFDLRGQLSGATFIDRNGDGIWGADEVPNADVTLYLDLNNNQQADFNEPTRITDSNGEYAFKDLMPGNYVVREIPLDRYQQTSPTTFEDVLFGIRHGVTPDTYFQIDAHDGEVIRQFTPTYDVENFRVGLDYDGQSLFVIDEDSHAVIELDAETGAELDRDFIEAGEYDGLAFQNGLIYISNYVTDDILIFDPIADVVIRKLDINGINPGRNLGGGLAAIANPDALVATTATDVVLFIDPQTGVVLSQFSHGGLADNGVAVLGDEVLLSYTNDLEVAAFERDGTFKRSFATNFPYYGLAGQRVEEKAHRVVLSEAGAITGLNFGNVSVNQAPLVDVGGPYEALEGQPITFDASATTDGERDALVFQWDLDGDGAFDDALGANPTVDAELLSAFGMGDDGTYEVAVLVSDNFDEVIAETTLTVANVAPVAADDIAETNEDTFVSVLAPGLLGNDSDVGILDVLSIESVDTTSTRGSVIVNADGSFLYDPNSKFEFLAVGEQTTDTFAYTVSDGDGGTAVATVTIGIAPAVATGERTFVDGVVRIGGTDEDDIIVLHDQGGLLYQNGVDTGIVTASIDEIRVWGRGGHDTIDMGNLSVASSLYGGAGDDTVVGGTGRDLIFGGFGNDHLTGSAGHDFLFGGEGADRLVGASGNDILVAGDLASFTTRTEVEGLLQLWSDQAVSAEDETAIDQVFSDDDFDMLTGASGADWFIIGSGDKITDLR